MIDNIRETPHFMNGVERSLLLLGRNLLTYKLLRITNGDFITVLNV